MHVQQVNIIVKIAHLSTVYQCGIIEQLLLTMDCVNDAVILRHVSFRQKSVVKNQRPILKVYLVLTVFSCFMDNQKNTISESIFVPSFFPPSIPGVTRWINTCQDVLVLALQNYNKNIYIITAHCTMLWYCAALCCVVLQQGWIKSYSFDGRLKMHHSLINMRIKSVREREMYTTRWCQSCTFHTM